MLLQLAASCDGVTVFIRYSIPSFISLKKREAFHVERNSEALSDLCLLDSSHSDSCIQTLCTKISFYRKT